MRIGVDLIEIERIRDALARYGDTFKHRCFTEAEREYCDSKPNPPQHYAGRFAAKEAVGKALGSGVYLEGRTAAWADKVGAGRIELSMTHSRELAAAVAVVVDEE